MLVVAAIFVNQRGKTHSRFPPGDTHPRGIPGRECDQLKLNMPDFERFEELGKLSSPDLRLGSAESAGWRDTRICEWQALREFIHS